MAAELMLMDNVLRRAACSSITGYQRYLSPYKGFRCAHRALHHDESCSAYAKRVISEQGISAALPAIRRRFAECREAYRLLKLADREGSYGPGDEGDAAPNRPAGDANKPGGITHSASKPRSNDAGCCEATSAACDIMSCGLDVASFCG